MGLQLGRAKRADRSSARVILVWSNVILRHRAVLRLYLLMSCSLPLQRLCAHAAFSRYSTAFCSAPAFLISDHHGGAGNATSLREATAEILPISQSFPTCI